MAFDEHLADRVRTILKEKNTYFDEKKMMGGLCFMVDGKMCVGIVKNDLMARISPVVYENSFSKKGVREMDFTGKPMKGYVFISPEGVDLDQDLQYWVDLCIAFNPFAKASKKK